MLLSKLCSLVVQQAAEGVALPWGSSDYFASVIETGRVTATELMIDLEQG